MLHRFILASVMVFSPLFAWANIIGDQDPRFQIALVDWLSGKDDLNALRELSAVAGEDNTAAQITIGLINRVPQSFSDVTKDLSQEERRAIFQKKDGRFGKRWMTVAAADHPLAALLTKRSVSDFEAHAMSLADEGAILDAIRAAEIATNQLNTLGTFRALSHPTLLPYTKLDAHWYAGFLMLGASMSNDEEEAMESAMLALSLPSLEFRDYLLMSERSGFIQPAAINLDDDVLRLRGESLLLHPDLLPLITIVAKACPDNTSYHMGLLFHLKGGTALRHALISPLEPIVSTAEWQVSGRFQRDFFAQWSLSEEKAKTLENLSPCLAGAAFEDRS